MVRFRNLLRHLRLRSQFQSGCLLNREQGASGLTLFRSPGSRRLRNGVLRRARGLRPGLLKGSRRDPVLVHFLDLPASARRFPRVRVVRGRLVIPTPVDLDNQGLSECLRLLSGLISPVPWAHLRRGDRFSLLAGRCLNPGARLKLLRGENQGVRLKARTSQTLPRFDHLSLGLQRARGQRTKNLPNRALLVERWIGIPRSTRY